MEESANRKHKIQQGKLPSPACAKEKPRATTQAGNELLREQLCGRVPAGLGGQ